MTIAAEAAASQRDAFLSPTLACTAKPISDAALSGGEVNTTYNSLVSRYTFAGTLTGFPCISLPCGADADSSFCMQKS